MDDSWNGRRVFSRDDPANFAGEAFRGVQSGSHSRSAYRQLAQTLNRRFQNARHRPHCLGIPGKTLTHANRNGVLQVGPGDLDDRVELAGLFIQRRNQRIERGNKFVMNRQRSGDIHSRGNHVIGRLPHVDVIVWMYKPLAAADGHAEQLIGPAGDYFVGVHVARRTRTRLEDIDGKMPVKFPFSDLRGCGNDCLGDLRIQDAQPLCWPVRRRSLSAPSRKRTPRALPVR